MASTDWIPLSQQVPEDWQKVLGFWPLASGKGTQATAVYCGGRWYEVMHSCDPTHWKPLGDDPVAPGEDNAHNEPRGRVQYSAGSPRPH